MNKESRDKVMAAVDWSGRLLSRIPSGWPIEFPPKTDIGFWREAARLEFLTRSSLHEKMRNVPEDLSLLPEFSDLEAWMILRRHEFLVSSAIIVMETDNIEIADTPYEFAISVLTDWWESDGCHSLFEHAIGREGAQNPDADARLKDVIKD